MKDQTRNLQQAAIAQLCKEIHIPMVGANFASLAEEARINLIPAVERPEEPTFLVSEST